MPWSTDFNLIIDSEAARIVLQAPWQQITLVPVETTLQVWFDDDDRAALRAAGTPLTSALSIQIDHWLDYLHTKAGEPGSWEYETERAYLHDPLALAAVFEPRFLTFTPMHIRVEIQDGLLRTLAVDGQLPNMLVATAVDAPGFRQWMLERLTRP